MSASPEPITVPDVEPIPLTIAALTAAARHTYLAEPAAESDAESADAQDVTPDGADSVRAPFSDIASYVLAAVAANLGGLPSLLASEVDPVHAEQVRAIVTGAAGQDELALLSYRTEPLHLTLDVADAFHDFGLEEMFDQEVDTLRRNPTGGSSFGFALGGSRSATSSAAVVTAPVLAPPLVDLGLLTDEGRDTMVADRPPTVPDHVDVDLLVQRMEELIEEDYADYLAAFEEAAEAVLAEYGASCAVEVHDVELEEQHAHGWDALSDAVHALTHRRALLPMTGQAPDWSDGTPADAVRRAGMSYTARALSSLALD